ncbi:MAG: hypothetical protein R2726_06835 [Acidimicrobiales bacterium]
MSRWTGGQVRPKPTTIVEIAAGVIENARDIPDPWGGVGSTPDEIEGLGCDLASDLIAAFLADNWCDPQGRWRVKEDIDPVLSDRLRRSWNESPRGGTAVEDAIVGRLSRRYGYARSDRYVYPTASRFADAVGVAPAALLGEIQSRHLLVKVEQLSDADRDLVRVLVERLLSASPPA